MAFPSFVDFELGPSPLNDRTILLNWREKDRSEHLFGPHQLSDGTLRFMALTALFLQPQENLPRVIVIDEPELGLHPYRALPGCLGHAVRDVCEPVPARERRGSGEVRRRQRREAAGYGATRRLAGGVRLRGGGHVGPRHVRGEALR